ncbi:uncharacterized protein LOC126846070 [Adelges cooleyi]|uniref:uncharacterized protein LOC126846070 n=1 Tax=Adelges cooleyi TaxID=133065 RepID=UPI0021806F51|nr:uncharacterized protein LOC126846070 [Adelges cooleyi]
MNLLRDHIHLAGRTAEMSGTWYYPPTVLDEDGYLWGSCADHLDRMFENRAAMRYYYKSVQPDAPVPLIGRKEHVAVAVAFVENLITYYQPLLAVDGLRHELRIQAVALINEAKVLLNFLTSMRP